MSWMWRLSPQSKFIEIEPTRAYRHRRFREVVWTGELYEVIWRSDLRASLRNPARHLLNTHRACLALCDRIGEEEPVERVLDRGSLVCVPNRHGHRHTHAAFAARSNGNAGILRAYHCRNGLLDHPLDRISTQGRLEDLADTGHRYLVHDIVLLRPCRALRDARLGKCSQFVWRYAAAGFQRYGTDRQFARIFVGLADCRCIRNRGMLLDHFLDQTRINVVPAADDEVF